MFPGTLYHESHVTTIAKGRFLKHTTCCEEGANDASRAQSNLHKVLHEPVDNTQKFRLRSHTHVSTRSATVSLDTQYFHENFMCEINLADACSSGVGCQQFLRNALNSMFSLPPCRAEGCRAGSKEKGSKIKNQTTAGTVLPREGPEERRVDEKKNIAKPKNFNENMLATSHTQTAKQSCEPQSSPSSSSCRMTRRGHGFGPIDVKALRCQEATDQERLLDLAESGTKTLSADRIVHRRCRTRAAWQIGNGLSTGSAGEPWSRARDDTKKGIGVIQM